MTSMGYAQLSKENLLISESSIHLLFVNPEYLDGVRGNITPNYARFLEGVVATWDATAHPDFDKREAPFQVTFVAPRGIVTVNYDSRGKIRFAKEKFKDVAIPTHLMRSIANKYPGWYAAKNRYKVNYARGGRINKVLLVQLRNMEGKKHSLKITDGGVIQ